ncbi:MAG: GNAT family N-acetyltransferase [Bacteroidales bacterium]|jgi:GNAT superfamily N-acetyltransferase|nr:GNAT family N-acetyltransferase [Bacteroidales bacterium]
MKLSIQEVKTKKDLKQFVTFQRQLYIGNSYYVPPLDRTEKSLFSSKNTMAEGCLSQLWIAKEENKIVGRIAAIINPTFNHAQKVEQARFSHFDSINKQEVAHALFQVAEQWAKAHKMKEMIGPFGFNNLDKHGMLVEGFKELSCQSSNYNFPYYQELVESYGFTKRHDWVERTITIPDETPEKIRRFAKVLRERSALKALDLSDKKILKNYTPRILELYNETYAQLYGMIPLNEKQKQHLLKSFIPMLNTDFVCVIVDTEDNIIAFAITMLSLSRSLQKANGRLFPFGFFHLMRNKKNNQILDLLLIGIHPNYQRKGIHALIFDEIHKDAYKNGISTIETTQNLESNNAIQNLWSAYESVLNKRARLYKKAL